MAGQSAIDSILKQLKEKKEELLFERVDLREEEGKFFFQELMKEGNGHVRALLLSGVTIDAGGSKGMGELLARSSRLRKFSLSYCDVGMDTLMQFAHAIARSTSLEVLDVNSCTITAALLCELLQKSESLRELHVRYTSLGDGSVDVVGTALEHKRLTKLSVGANSVSDAGMVRICAALKNKNTSLRSIDLSSNPVNEEGKKALAEVLRSDKVLEEINLSSCELKDEGVVMMAEALQFNVVLKKIGLGGNAFGGVGGKAVALMLQKNCTLKSLNVSQNYQLRDEGCKAICEGMKSNRSITSLILYGSSLLDKDLVEIAAMLTANFTLQMLDVRFCEHSDNEEGAMSIAKALVGHNSLRELLWPNMSNNLKQQIKELLMKDNGSLISCGSFVKDVCERNAQMQDSARQAVQTLRVLRNGKPNIFHLLPKDVLKIIGMMVWASRTEVKTWSTKK